jgi:DNA-binding CsgD family transcriptional regulator
MLSLILGWQALGAFMTGDPNATRAAAEEGCRLANHIGDRFNARLCRWCLSSATMIQGDLVGVVIPIRELVAEAEAAHDVLFVVSSLRNQGHVFARMGEHDAAHAAAAAAIEASGELGEWHEGLSYQVLATAALAAGDVSAADEAVTASVQRLGGQRETAAVFGAQNARVALACGDAIAARRFADQSVSTTSGWHLASALAIRARVAIAQGELDQAERDAHDALAVAADVAAYLDVPDTLECVAGIAVRADSHREAVRLLGAADAMRLRAGSVRFRIDESEYQDSLATLHDALSDSEFESLWADGARLSTEEAIAYAQRGRGERKRPSSGWSALTPMELEVVRLVADGLGNKDIAARLFISHRTVQTHLTHVYSKLGLISRLQLAQQATRRAQDAR